MRKYIFLLLSLLIFSNLSFSQALSGFVKDSLNKPVEFATIVLQKADSMYVDNTLTDSLGYFAFKSRPEGNLRLLVQHLNYDPVEKIIKSNDPDTIYLTVKEKANSLGEVIVTTSRPEVKIKDNGAISYNAQQLTKNRAVSNAFEIIKEIPGITGSSEEIELIGAGAISIVLNGKPTSLSGQQVYDLLKSIPSSRVKEIEIMYSAPARYNVNGGLINVILDEKTAKTKNLQAEAGAEYRQSYYPAGTLRGNLIYQTSNFSLDMLATVGEGKSRREDMLLSRRVTPDNTIELEQETKSNTKFNAYTFRTGVDYTFKNKDILSFAYYFEGSGYNVETNAFNDFRDAAGNDTHSTNRSNSNEQLHNAQIQYSGQKGLNAGIDFTYYRSPDNSHFTELDPDSVTTNDYLNNSLQENYRWTLFLNRNSKISNSWSINYGATGGINKSDNFTEYLYPQQDGAYSINSGQTIENNQKEYTGNFFVGTTGKWGDKISLTASLKTEYFRSNYELNGQKSTLWNEWAIFPTATISYNPTNKSTFQFNLSSDKNYPSYWSVSPQTTQINSYTYIIGNPALKPSKSYEGQLLYILNRKYTFMTFANYSPGTFRQLPYQDENMNTIYRFENLDFKFNTGFAVIVPFKIGLWNSHLTAYGFRIEEKMSDFHGKSFDNIGVAGMIMSNNTFTLSKINPNLSIQMDGYYQSSGVQGIYDLGKAYNLSSAVKWTFKNNSYLSLKYNDILQHRTPKPIIVDWEGQYSKRINKDFSSLVLSFAWRFGQYEKKNYEEPDNSRFGR